MQCLKTELPAVTAVTAVVVMMMMVVVAAILYLLLEINNARKMILQGEN
jgi:hypothetical protein